MSVPLKILFISAEVAPFAKVGGLADVAGSLPKELVARGHEVRVLMPGYGMILGDPSRETVPACADFPVKLNGSNVLASLYQFEYHGLSIWLLNGGGLFDAVQSSAEVYSPGRDAYLFFASAALRACQVTGWIPDVVHCNDWHTGFIPVLMREMDPRSWETSASVFTIHNLAYQGEFGNDTLDAIGLPQSLFNPDQLETYGSVNFLKSGAVYADQVNTVSPTYAQEIQTPEFGCRLEGLMKYLAEEDKLSGILNGIDYDFFNPEIDDAIAKNYSASKTDGKSACRDALLEELGLSLKASQPILGMVTRLSNQKGFDLVLEAAPRILGSGACLIVQGLGDPWAASGLQELEASYPNSVRFIEKFDPDIAQRIYAGSDMFLMPSAFEPCGLGQMIAMRYGTLPIVRRTGGLADTVFEGVNGFVFESKNSEELIHATGRAIKSFEEKAQWETLVARAMEIDHSWTKSAETYESLYVKALDLRRAKPLAATG